MRPRLTLLLFVLLVFFGGTGARAAADPDEVPLSFARLDLRDGRKLKNVVIKTYDAKTQTLLIVAAGKAMTIPIALVPPPFNEQLKRAPESGSSVSTLSAPPRQLVTAADQYSLSRPVMIPTPAARSEPQAMPTSRPAQAGRVSRAELNSAAEVAAHRKAALDRVDKYYRYEHRMGSNNIKVSRVEFETEESKPVTGYEGRYRTEGKAFIEFYDSIHFGSYQRTTALFEVITERKPGGAITVLDFTRKS